MIEESIEVGYIIIIGVMEEDVMFTGSVTVDGVELPEAFLGSAPFTAAPYFGHRSRLYEMDLKRRPENIAEVLIGAYDVGVRGFQIIPEGPVLEALEMAVDAGCGFRLMGTLREGHLEDDLGTLMDLGVGAVLLDEHYTDLLPAGEVAEILDDIDVPSGLITTMPGATTRRLIEEGVDNFQLYMMPLNSLGYMMDFPVFLEEERAELRDLLLELGKVVVAEKVLAAGILSPREAFKFLEGADYVDMVTVGAASVPEVKETFGELFRL
ncbi:hypothetical protein [Methanothermobacter sp. K4]|uniref:hypothetical protein n=1 Tax=Methanothermobacter sp. K4 TaxID=2913262 RepID=UPI001EDAFE3A|nr:hypothetical protein [Methanothermobacter sp. K4]MCG2828359.1 hypothetical protein [Methanothermobacter sp. K4]